MRVFKTMWGVDDLPNQKESWDRIFQRIKSDGFDGVELCIGPFHPAGQNPEDQKLFLELLKKNDLAVIAQLHTCGYPVGSCKVQDHIESFKELSLVAAACNPVLINSHSGKDSFTREESLEFFKAALEWEKTKLNGIKVVHETHRQRIFYSPFVYRDMMKDLPADLKINADLSHWAVVCERCLDDELDKDFWPAVVEDLARRTDLIHCRVGYSQGPQVNDPEAPEHKMSTDAHIKWWKALVAGMKKRGVEVIVEPEFGAIPYLQTLPYSNVPVVDLWKINTLFGQRMRKELDI